MRARTSAGERLHEIRQVFDKSPGDGLKAAEMLARMCGWNEPERVTHQHQHLHVDSGLIAQLREGYATLSAGGAKGAPLLAEGPVPAEGPGAGYPRTCLPCTPHPDHIGPG
jgi:hypothetical protein